MSSRLAWTGAASIAAAALFVAPSAGAQTPQYPPQQGYPPQGGYPPPQQGYPPQGGYPPPQGYPPQGGYPPPQGYPPQGGYPPPQGYPPQGGYPPPGYPPPPPQNNNRGAGEMTFLYVTSALYGVGTGVWLDALAKVKDPGIAIIMPIGFGAAAPVGVYLWDEYGGPFHRGVPASMATGLALGAVEGVAISGTQWQYTREKGHDWTFQTQTTVTWVLATGGGVGGWAFGEWIRPDPRSMGFIASGAAWGALSGTFFGTGISGKDWKDGASVAGLVGYNAGIVGAGALSIASTPSWNAQKNMWIGYGLGTLAGCLVFPVYLFVPSADPKHGFIGPALGGLAGVAIAGALSWDLKDPEDTPRRAAFKPPFDVSLGTAPRIEAKSVNLGSGYVDLPLGTLVNASGSF